MSVLVECLNVIVRRSEIESRYPGGLAGYAAACPNATLCADSNLVRVGFMDKADIGEFCLRVLSRAGLASSPSGRPEDVEIPDDSVAIVEADHGPWHPRAWLSYQCGDDGVCRCWLSAALPGDMAVPDGWTPPSPGTFVRLPDPPLAAPGGTPSVRLYRGRAYPARARDVAYVGIDIAVADGKRLPVCVCRWHDGRLVPLPLKRPAKGAAVAAWMLPPEMPGNERIVDPAVRAALAREAVEYLRAVEEGWGVRITRIGLDAPREVGPGEGGLRACEAALRDRGLFFIQTPGQAVFDRIPEDVAAYQRDRGARRGLPRANQIWMLFGFDLFRALSAEGWECLEVYPQATVRVIGSGERNKRSAAGVLEQLTAAAAHTGWPDPVSLEPLRAVAFGKADDCLDAYLSAWVAALEESDREPLGKPPLDAIWIPRFGAAEVRVAGDGVQRRSLTRRFDEALVYVSRLHEGTLREEASLPYASHVPEVSACVLEDGGSEDEAIAALLHDAVEDAGGEHLEAIRARFGERVAAIIAGCSDRDESPKPPWRERRERYVRRLRAAADASMLRVSLADKLHSARALLRDHRAVDEAIWDRFNVSAGDLLWYFELLLAVFREKRPGPAVDELAEAVGEIRARHERAR